MYAYHIVRSLLLYSVYNKLPLANNPVNHLENHWIYVAAKCGYHFITCGCKCLCVVNRMYEEGEAPLQSPSLKLKP